MKKCENCNQSFFIKENYCCICGASLIDVCSNCGKPIEDANAKFCYNCGVRIDSELVSKKTDTQKSVKNVTKKLLNNEFVKSVKQDFENSQSLGIVKEKVKDTAKSVKNKAPEVSSAQTKKIGIIGGVLAVIIVFVVLVTSIHTCDECDKTYFGKKHTVTFWGETENLCKDCYNDFYRW